MEASERKSFQIKVCLKGDIQNQMKEINKLQEVFIIPPLMNLGELIGTVIDTFRIPHEVYHVKFYYGFPPKELIGGAESLVSTCVQGGDVIHCHLVSKTHESTERNNNRPTNTSSDISEIISNPCSSSNISNEGRKKRAASKAACASFKTVIAQQNKLIREESGRKTSKNHKKPLSAAQAIAVEKMNKARKAASNSRKLERLEGGRALKEDVSKNDSPSQQHRIKKSSSLFKNISSEEDVSFALINAMNRGSTTKVSKVLRSAMRNSIQKSYEVSRAIARNSAISSKSGVEFDPIQTSEFVNNDSGTFLVKYSKGIDGAGLYEENCHIISIEMLSAVVKAVYDDNDNDEDEDTTGGKEMLKPTNMALLSPRVFWSLWYHHRHSCSSMEEALEKLLPGLEWKFLYKRNRQLSEKARENLIQEQMKSGENVIGSASGLNAIKAVEGAIEDLYDSTISTIREKAAQAAISRMSNDKILPVSNALEWIINTPTEEDEDELRECIIACDNFLSDVEIDYCIQVLLSAKVMNWRILANCTTQRLEKYFSSDIVHLKENIVDCWIAEAQRRSIDEIMLEILDGNQDLFETLRDQASSGTPKDLSLWHDMSDILLEVTPSLRDCNEDAIEDKLIVYCAKAKHAINLFPWLSDYSTSIGKQLYRDSYKS